MNNVLSLSTTLTNKEASLVVDVSNPLITEFSDANLKTFNKFFNPASSPNIYGSAAIKGVIFDSIQLVDVDKINLDNESSGNYSQIVRVTINPETQAISLDIANNGFSLTEEPIMVFESGNGRFDIGEGRTRLNELKKFGITKIIVAVFKKASPATRLKFALMMNTTKKPFGVATAKDLERGIMKLIELGEIAKYPNTESGRDELRSRIREELNLMANNKLKPAQYDAIVNKGVESSYGISMYESFPNGNGVTDWLDKNGYVNTREIEYIPVAEFLEKVAKKMTNLASDLTKSDVTEFRFIIYKGTLSSSNPEKDWKANVLGFKKTYDEFEAALSKIRFNGASIDESRFKIYACIPQCANLKDKYPMNKLVIY